MERWLSKPRALAALCAVLLLAALNRQDPMVYGVFLLLAAIAVLGYLLPWSALRGVVLEQDTPWPSDIELTAGEALPLGLRLRQQAWWPAWMVVVDAHWEWGGREFVSSTVVPVLRPRGTAVLPDTTRFTCRGRYRLLELRLHSGFPLGLARAERVIDVATMAVLVHPAPCDVRLGVPWDRVEDEAGDHPLRRIGESLELHALRPYRAGDTLRRVDWRASARAGGLVVREFQTPASPLIRLTLQPPSARDIGNPEAGTEQALRVAASLASLLERKHLRCSLCLPGAQALRDPPAMARALAMASPSAHDWATHLLQQARLLRAGETLLAVVEPAADAQALATAAHAAQAVRAHLVVAVALLPQAMGAGQQAAADELRNRLAEAPLRIGMPCLD